MAEKVRYPQIPSTVWWGLRSILTKSPNTTVDDRFLSVQLGVQPAAAKQYIGELINVGLLNEDSKATTLALRWRLDQSHVEAATKIIENVYPEGLRNVAPPDEGDRQKAISWFLQEGLGKGAAGNKAATYMMIGSKVPNESPVRSNSTPSPGGNAETKVNRRRPQKQGADESSRRRKLVEAENNDFRSKGGQGQSLMPLNVNVQIHVSADASTEQIEAIFSAMKRYLYEQQDI